jgi:hypothetical protein
MTNDAELAFWEVQDRAELKTLMAEARALGLDALDIALRATEAYPQIKQMGFNRALIDRGIFSEGDAARRALRNAIRRAETERTIEVNSAATG